jgi:hypothetical protein
MTREDMEAAKRAAESLGEVIVFRSTGPWAKRWLARKYPSKNFHVKGKSSDWGPHAGFVPFDGSYSKVGYDAEKAAKGTKANLEGLDSRFASKAPPVLTLQELRMQQTEASAGRTPIARAVPIAGSDDLVLFAAMSGGGLDAVPFRALKLLDGRFEIRAFPLGTRKSAEELAHMVGFPLEVMTSNEVGAKNMPMTGDYDLFAVCPPAGDYMGQTLKPITKKGIRLVGAEPFPDFTFPTMSMLDKVIDPTLHTGGTESTNYDAVRRKGYETGRARERGDASGPVLRPDLPAIEAEHRDEGEDLTPLRLGRHEHPDMGNLTPRILRAINALNHEMRADGDDAPFRRVHHNAESHRNAAFGALTKKDMLTKKDGENFGDGFPLTVFQPRAARADGKPASIDSDVCTLETYDEFVAYVDALSKSGFWVPKNWAWAITKTIQANAVVAEFVQRMGRRD